MRLGTETGSLVSHVMTSGRQPEPAVDMPATICHWTDRSAGTVIRVWHEGKGKIRFIEVQGDTAKVVSGSTQDGSAAYEYSRDPNGGVSTWREVEPGKWQQVRKGETGRWKKYPNGGLVLGYREAHHDPSF